jgi:hypothetical protein
MASRQPARMIGTVTVPIGADESTMTSTADSTRTYRRPDRKSSPAGEPEPGTVRQVSEGGPAVWAAGLAKSYGPTVALDGLVVAGRRGHTPRACPPRAVHRRSSERPRRHGAQNWWTLVTPAIKGVCGFVAGRYASRAIQIASGVDPGARR